jgi:foldase protein PrsA
VLHEMRLQSAGMPLPDPPGYLKCVARLRRLSAGSRTPQAERTEAKLRQNCEGSYEQHMQQALETLVHRRWLAGEAAELGIRVSPAEVREEVDASKKAFKSDAEFQRYLANAGESLADVGAQARLNKLTAALFAHIEAKEHLPSEADVATYYAAHRARFAISAGRDVRIVRTASAASAAGVGQQLRAGKSFAAVARELSAIGQPIGARGGEVKDLKSGAFEEHKLNDAIFHARPHRLYGPLQLTASHKTIAPETNTGFFFFEVVRATPGGRLPFDRVKAQLRAELVGEQKERTFPPFILAYRRRWKSRTDCRPGYVVMGCRQYKGSKAQEEVDPYTL